MSRTGRGAGRATCTMPSARAECTAPARSAWSACCSRGSLQQPVDQRRPSSSSRPSAADRSSNRGNAAGSRGDGLKPHWPLPFEARLTQAQDDGRGGVEETARSARLGEFTRRSRHRGRWVWTPMDIHGPAPSRTAAALRHGCPAGAVASRQAEGRRCAARCQCPGVPRKGFPAQSVPSSAESNSVPGETIAGASALPCSVTRADACGTMVLAPARARCRWRVPSGVVA